jgi:NTP pyrophosphatase (non-canonical NTP hydrolase)
VTIRSLIKRCHKQARDKGWHDRAREFPEVAALLHSEISEALEEYRKGRAPSEVYTSEGGKPEGIAAELADVAIRLFDYCGEAQIDLESAIHSKLKFNETRSQRHGGKRV